MPTDGPQNAAALGRLPTCDWERLEALLEPFERAWQAAAGPGAPVDLAPFVPPPEDPLRPVALVELIKADLECRWRHGHPVRLETYLHRFPEIAPAGQPPADLLFEEYRVRQRHGDHPSLTEYRARFPDLFPELERRLNADPPSTRGDSTLVPAPRAEQVFPGYEVRGRLGRGGMGVVYRAWDVRHRKHVALKTLLDLDPAALYRFKQEFRALAGLAHPNLVTLYELRADEQTCFFTMELLQGVDFLTYVRDVPRPGHQTTAAAPVTVVATTTDAGPVASPPASAPGPEALCRLRDGLGQLVEGILALHDAGKLHRDLKPGNVLVTPEGRVVLLDFGLAAELDCSGLHHSTEEHVLGTIPYMAPEQAACQPVSPASDWYAFGVLLYEALTGRLPFTGPPLQILVRKQQEDPPPPRQVAPGVPDDLDALCTELLRRDPAARPSGREVQRRLAEAAGVAPASRPPSAVHAAPLVGRERHLRALGDAYRDAGQGRAVVMFVHGRSGAGKSALVQRFLEEVAREGPAVVLAGRCYEQESVPYKALDGLLDALSRYLGRLPAKDAEALLPRDVHALARVFPVLQRVEALARAPRRAAEANEPQEVRRRATAALRELLGRLGDRRPLVLAIDDLQWGDADSAAVLADMLRPPEPPALLLIACCRSDEAAGSPCVQALLRPPGGDIAADCRELAVEPLTAEEGRQLALTLLGGGGARAAQAEAVARESGGNPFFIYELVQALQAGAGPQAPPAAGPPSLPDVLWERVRRLPEASRRLVEVVAVAGRPLRQADACRAAGWPDEDLTALAQLRAGRVLRGRRPADCQEIETYHDRIRETVLARLGPDICRDHHVALARVLEASGVNDPELLAVHWLGAGDRARAGRHYEVAADRAAEALAFDRAAKLYELALELQAPPAEDGRRLRVRLADALANAGRGRDSARQYLAAAQGAGADEALELRRRAALQLLISGHIDDGLGALSTVLESVGLRLRRGPRESLWSLVLRRLQLRLRGLGFRRRDAGQLRPAEVRRIDVCWSAAVGLSLVDPIQGAYFQTRSLLLALRAGEPYHLARALALEAAHVSIGGSKTWPRTTRLLAAAEGLARQVDNPHATGLVKLAQGVAAALAGDWPAGRALSDEAEEVFRTACTGVVWERDTAQRFALWPLMFLGAVDELARRVPLLLREAQERDDLYAVMNVGLVIRPFLRLCQDEPAQARAEVAEAMGRWSQRGYHVQHMNRLHDEVQIDLYQGDGPGAWRRLTEHWPLLRRLHFLRVQQVRIFLLHLRARCALAAAGATHDPRPLLLSAERDAGRLRREGAPWADALAQLVLAAVAHRRGDAGRSAELLRAGAAACEATAMRLHAAAVRRCLGQLLGGDEGRALESRADAWMTAQGVRDPARVAALLVPGFTG